MLLKSVGLQSIFHTLRYLGLPKEAGMFARGYAPFRNAALAFLVTDRHNAHAACCENGWNCEFKQVMTEMEAFETEGDGKGEQQLIKFACDVRGLTFDLVRIFIASFF
jgi:hypothetical protein